MLLWGLSGIVFFINYIWNRQKILEYELLTTCIYLITFIYAQSFDVLFVLYLFFFILPFLNGFRKIRKFVFFFIIYIAIKMGSGLLHESLFSVMATFLTRYFPLLFLTCMNNVGQWKDKVIVNEEIEQRILRILVVFEILICIWLYTLHNRDIFVINHQPVGANLSLAGVLLAMDQSLKHDKLNAKYKIENMLYAALFILLAVISGIRGYIVVIVPCALFTISNNVFGESKRKVGLVLSGILALGIMVMGYVTNGTISRIIESFQSGIGYRALENTYFSSLISGTPFYRWIFGYWIAAKGGTIGASEIINLISEGSDFYYSHLMDGSSLLNFWITVMKDMGLVGVAIFVWMFVNLYRRNRMNLTASRRIGFCLYLILYAFMLAYRSSCTNGLLEFFMIYAIGLPTVNVSMKKRIRRKKK